jgi:PEGA domain-containing protein
MCAIAGKLLALSGDMKPTSFGLTAALLAILAATPAIAQERDAKRREAARAEQNAQRQAQPQREAARSADQSRGGEQARSAEQSRGVDRSRPRREEAPRVQAPAVQAPSVQVPSVQAPVTAPRVEPRNDVVGRAVPRTSPSYNTDRQRYERERADRDRHSDRDRRSDRERYDRDRRYYSYSPRYAPHAYIVRPYLFRPRVSIGFGIFAGYPVPYAWRYTSPIYVYGYRAPRAPVYISPGMALYGGIALEISPYDADVFVDGNYAGRVEDFDGTVQPLTVVAGTHRIEVQAPGYAPLVFDVVVEGGQVIPYRGDLRPF